MDDPPYIDESGYVPISSPPSNPCLYRPKIDHHQSNNNYLPPPRPLAPPQLLPPPPQQLRRHHHHPPPVTKVHFHSPNSQFQFSPNFSPKPHIQYHHHRSNDFGLRISINDDRHQLIDHRQHLASDFNDQPDLWDLPSRSLPDHGPVVSNLDHLQFQHRPMSPYRPVDKIKHQLDTSYRFRDRYINDGVQFEYKSSNNSNQRVEFVPHYSHSVSDTHRLNSTSSSYDNQHGSQFHSNEFMSNNVRDVALDRHVLRDRESRDSFFGRGLNYENGDNGVRAFSGKHEFYGSGLGRYNTNRGSREDSYEYNRTPRKQVQKKSALLRIQKPYYRNRDDGELHYLGYEMKSGSFRGKDQVVFPECEVGEYEQRGGSPVELDVSFKSNSLVAKAIMAPSSSAIVCDANLTTKKGNTRKIIMSDKDHSSSPMKKPLDSSRKLGGSRDAVNNRDSKQSENKGLPSGATMSDNNSQTRSSGSKNLPAKIIVENSNVIVREKWGTDVGTTKTSSLKVAKKKKVAKKVVKNAINPTELVSSSQPIEKLDEPVKADGSSLSASATLVLRTGVKPSKYKITSVAMASGHLEDLQTYTNDANMMPGNDLVGGSPQAAMKSEEVSPDGNSCVPCITKIKRKRNSSLSPLASSSHKETKTDEGSVIEDNSLHALYIASNTGKDLTKLPSETNFSDIGSVEGADNQFCRNGYFSLLENAETKESPETLLPEGRYINSDLLRLGENRKHEGLVNTCSFAHGMKTNTGSINGLLSSQGKIANSDIGIQSTSTQQPCKGQMSLSVYRSTVEGFPLVIPPGSYEIPALSSSDETGIHNVSIHASCSNREKCSVSGSDNFSINSEEITPGTGEFNARQQARNEVTISLENSSAEGFPITMFSAGSSEEDMSNNTDKRKVMMPLSDFPNAMISVRYMGLVKSVSSVKSTNTTLSLSVKDCCLAEAGASEGMDADGLKAICGHNSTGGYCETNVSDSGDLNGASPENRTGRKVSAFFLGCSSMIASEISEGPVTLDLSSSRVELLSNSNEGLIQPEEGVAVSNIDTLFDSSLPACTDRIALLLENNSARVSSEVAVSASRYAFGFGDDSLKVEPQRADSSSALGESMSSCPPGSESKQIVNENLVLDGRNYNNEVMCMENNKSENMETFVVGEQVKACSEVTESQTPPEHQSPDLLNQILPATDVSDGCLFEKGDFPSASAYRALAAEGDGVSTTIFNDELMEFDSPSSMGSPEIFFTGPVMSMMNHEASTSQISNEKDCGIDKLPNEKPVDEGTSNLSAHTSLSEHAKINLKLDYFSESAHLVARKTISLPVQDVIGTGHNLNLTSGETYQKKNQPSHSVYRVPPRSSSSVFTASRNVGPSTCTINPRTWHRTESSSAAPEPGNKSFLRTVPPPNQLLAKFQCMTYIRKGNSLVRKPALVAALPQVSHGLTSSVYWLNSSGIGESKKTRGSESSADVIDPTNFLSIGGVNTPSERPRTPPLLVVAKVPNHSTNSTGDCTSSPVADPLPNGVSETTSDPQKLMEINDELNYSNAAVKISETPVKPTGSVNSLESQGELNDGTLSTSDVKRITYLKRKSNQLIAASNDCGLSVQNPNSTQNTTSDLYFKRRKSQLIRSPLESHINQTVSSADGSFTSKGEKGPKDFRGSSNKNQSYKAVKKIRKPLIFSLVWRLNNMQSSKNDHSSYRQKVLPCLFPWKRTVYWRRFAQDSVSIANGSCLSAISRKLLLLRKRETVYTRSNHGFSLRKSKVLSVGGSSLKWSKSIENRSKKVNEEATLAVAAVEKKKQQNGAESFPSETKNRSCSCRGRIFRIGSVRYKMDSSKRTLQRISDDESPCTAAPISGKNAKKSYIPRRLVIGNDEYVRIGNGNQLVRDPKKRARFLASEKVRWSLHTARLRLARKRKYCQFFTRFGKCNKGDGKCPYIHDPSKIAVCTKFLNGLCSNSDCKLTHKVIPERMPDCSYFVQGLCTNKNCPYRHVHVNPNASTCEGFLKGYCADSNECRKKHSYVCPTFEATGSCPLGSKCKLHHPKSQSKGKKSRRSRKQNSTHGRYFGSMILEDPEPHITMSERHSIQDNDNLFIEGKLADYIDLDVSEEEDGEANDGLHEPTTFNESDASDLQLDDLDELIKPIRMMKSPVGSFSLG